MWITSVQLFTVLSFVCFNVCHGVEKDIEVECLDSKAITIKDGGIIANCAQCGLTRTTTNFHLWLYELKDVLQAVNVSHNHIKKVSKFSPLPRVLSLNLQHNSIRDIDPQAFTDLDNLQNLDLSDNRINGGSLRGVFVGKKVREHYESLPIRTLYLGHNNISVLYNDTFLHLEYLRDLHLDYNPLVVNEDFSNALSHLPELKLLNLAGAGLKSLPKDTFSGLRLTKLLLNGNQFTQVPALSELGSSLRLLNINQNPISELDASSFSGLRSISEIVVSGMPKLSTVKAGTFSNLENLRVVSCSYNPELTSVDEAAFWDKTVKHFTLQEVYLNDNALQTIRKTLLPWIKMSKVTLDGNRWVCDCQLHWLAKFLRNRNATVDRLMDVKCWDPPWLNGTQMVFWNIDLVSRHENFPCQAELEAERKETERKEKERLEQERLRQEQEQLRVEQERVRLKQDQAKLHLEQEVKNVPAETERKEKERLEQERLRQEQEQLRVEQERVRLKQDQAKLHLEQEVKNVPAETEESSVKFYHLIAIVGIIALVVLIGSVIAFNKYRNYRPIYNVEKMSSPMHNEMKDLKGTLAEKSHLVG
uniref:LRRCT domain-containing protein n=1 Tax=Homalodisca liturata TaxID=320908 RepID=A0A1B6IEX1_9HEMI